MRRPRTVIGLVLLASLLATSSAVAGPTAASATQLHFRSPSGNINCYVFSTAGGVADCLVRQATWRNKPPKPASCDLDWAPTELQLTRTHVTVGGCRGDVGPRCYPGGDRCSVLAYGHSVTLGPVRCSSATTGVTCRRTTGSRPGFTIARERYTVYR